MIRFPPYDVTTDPDAQVAESWRYGDRPFMVLPLPSGKIAVLGFQRALHAICDDWSEVEEAAKSIEFTSALRRIREREERRPKPLPAVNLDDLGL